MTMPCPCGTDLDYPACCGLWHGGRPAPTAEALMRSRYVAFVRRDLPYLTRTSHPFLRGKMSAKDMRNSFALTWTGLEILGSRDGGPNDTTGMVHFRASFRQPNGQAGHHEERSRFVRIDAEWLYRDGAG